MRLQIKGSNLPVDFEPTEVTVEVSNTSWVTFGLTNNTFYPDSRSLKTSMTLKNFDKDKDFEAYMSCAARSMTFSEIKEGNINVVFMGDGFSDRQIADGTYRQVMEQGMQAFLSEEPFASYAGSFNIYYVDAVSAYEGCIEPSNEGRTKFSTYFGNGTHVGGDNQQAINYTLKVPGLVSENLDNYLTIVMMNSTKHAGTCWMSYPKKEYDYYK